MAARALRSALGVRTTIAPLYTGGPVALAHDGSWLFCSCGDDVNVIALPSGQLVRKLKSVRGSSSSALFLLAQPEDPIIALVAHPTEPLLLCATRALLVKVYNLESGSVVRSFKVLFPIASCSC